MTSVCIGIPTLNGDDRLGRVLASIEACTNFAYYPKIKILVCDDGSRGDLVEVHKTIVHHAFRLREHAGLELLVHGARAGIACSWNDLVHHTAADVHVLLNDDVEVDHDWLDVLVYSVANNPHAGMVGLNSWGGLIKAQMATIHPDVPEHIRRPRRDFTEARLMGGESLISSHGYAFAFRRECFDEVGGFDTGYKCFYEEVDFGIRLRQKGYHHYMASYPTIYHMGGATTSRAENMNASEDMANSRNYFIRKWGEKTLGEFREELWKTPPPSRQWHSQMRNWR